MKAAKEIAAAKLIKEAYKQVFEGEDSKAINKKKAEKNDMV